MCITIGNLGLQLTVVLMRFIDALNDLKIKNCRPNSKINPHGRYLGLLGAVRQIAGALLTKGIKWN